jgi:putative membrane protein
MAAAPAFAQTTQSTAKPKAARVADQSFVMNAARGGMAEVELGKLAEDKGESQEVKDFGKRMVDDHGKANDELKSIAQNKNITLPSDLSAKDKKLRDRLTKLSGAAFDRAYMQAMVGDHRVDINEFRQESKTGKDADVKAFASKTLPTLEDHLKMAQTTDKAVVGTSGARSTTGAKKATTKAKS